MSVKEKIEGLIDLKGELTGPLSDISGNAKTRLRNGNLYGVDIASLICRIFYKNGVMSFEDDQQNVR